jgi:uncharacterized protein YidB (DUF937 family)
MARAYPSLTALLALLAVAGYQNRDRLAEMLGSRTSGEPPARSPDGSSGTPPAGGLLDGLLGQTGGASGGAGGLIAGAIGQLLERFGQGGQRQKAESWVQRGPNLPITEPELEQAIGEETLEDLTRQTGLPRQEILARLSRELPRAVDMYTPEGRPPD